MAQVKRFYTEVLGFSDFDHEPKFDYLYIRTGSHSSLGFMRYVVYRQGARALEGRTGGTGQRAGGA